MAGRLAARGAAGGYFPGPTVAHDHGRRDPAEIADLWRSYAFGAGAYKGSLLLRSGTRVHGVRALARMVASVAYRALDPELRPQSVTQLRGWAHYLAYRAGRSMHARRG